MGRYIILDWCSSFVHILSLMKCSVILLLSFVASTRLVLAFSWICIQRAGFVQIHSLRKSHGVCVVHRLVPPRVTVTHIERSHAYNLNNNIIYNSLCRTSSTSSSLKAPPRSFLKWGSSFWSGGTCLPLTGPIGTSHFLFTFGFADAL